MSHYAGKDPPQIPPIPPTPTQKAPETSRIEEMDFFVQGDFKGPDSLGVSLLGQEIGQKL